MVIKLPADLEDAVNSRVSAAGFRDADEYVLTLVRQDQELRRWEEKAARDSRLEAIAQAGLASGAATPLDLTAMRQSFRERLPAKES